MPFSPPNFQELTVRIALKDQALRRIVRQGLTLADDLSEAPDMKVRVYDGMVRLGGSLDLVELWGDHGVAGLIVNGDLTVEGSILDFELDSVCTFLVVRGNLRAENLMTSCALIWVEGDVRLANVMMSTYNHGLTVVKGGLDARIFICDGHDTRISGKVRALTCGSGAKGIKGWDYDEVKEVLDPALAPLAEGWDVHIHSALSRGLDPFRKDLASRKKAAAPAVIVAPGALSEFVTVEGGTFQMGPTAEASAYDVTVDSFLMGRFPVSGAQYLGYCAAIRRKAPRLKADHPATGLDWYDAIAYCNWRSEAEGLQLCYRTTSKDAYGDPVIACDFDATGYRLPTEAEWEYAARGGRLSLGYAYCGSNRADEVAWHRGNSGGKIQPLGQKLPNELGLYDLVHVPQWCWDRFPNPEDWAYFQACAAKAAKGERIVNPRGPAKGEFRAARGAGFWLAAKNVKPNEPYHDHPTASENSVGFRLVRRGLPSTGSV